MESNETSRLVVRSVIDQSLVRTIEEENMSHKAKNMLANHGADFESKTVKELGPLKDIKELDITQPDHKKKYVYSKKFLKCIDEEIEEIRSNNQYTDDCNDCLKSAIIPSRKFACCFLTNLVLSGAAVGGLFIIKSYKDYMASVDAFWANEQTWEDCYNARLNPCINGTAYNGTTYNCPPCPVPPGNLDCMDAAIKCCDKLISPICNPIGDAAGNAAAAPTLAHAKIILTTGIITLCTLQVLIQLFRLCLRRGNTVTQETIDTVNEYKSALAMQDSSSEIVD